MKQFCLFLLFTIGFQTITMSQQQFSTTRINAEILKHKSQLRAQYAAKVAAQRNNSSFRLDSLVTFSEYTGVDSLKSGKNRYSYVDDTLIINQTQYLDQGTGNLLEGARYILKMDLAGREKYFAVEQYAGNGQYQTFYSEETFFSNATGDKKDAIKAYFQNFSNGELYLFQLVEGFQYDANDNEISRTTTDYVENGAILEIVKKNSVYLPNNKVDTIYNYSGVSVPTLQLASRESYHYTADSIVSVSQMYEPQNGTWSLSGYRFIVNDQNNNPVQNYSYLWDNVAQAWKIFEYTILTYTAEQKIATKTYANFNGGNFQYGYHTDIFYNGDGNEWLDIQYNIDPSTGQTTTLDQKDYFYYTEVSGIPVVNNGSTIMVMPNPAKDAIYVQSDKEQIQSVELIDHRGQILRRIDNPGTAIQKIDRGNLPAGMYIVKAITNSGISTRQIYFN